MSLRVLAEADLAVILEDDVTGFGWPITVTAPTGAVATVTGFSDDISQLIDAETGQAVSGRLATVAIRVSTLLSFAGMSMPRGIADAGEKPWVVEFNDINGNVHKFKVRESNPDRALGIVVCILEAYR